MATIAVNLPLNIGVSGTYLLFLYDGSTLLNSGGDTLTEDANGYYEATVAETVDTTVAYRADVTRNGVRIYSGWLHDGNVVDRPLTVAEIAAALSGIDVNVLSLSDAAISQIRATPTTPPLLLDIAPLEMELPNLRDIVFGWPVDGATIVAYLKNSAGEFIPTTGSVVQLSEATGDYEYRLQYHVNDRPTVPASVRYKFTDDVYTRYLTVNFKLPTTFIDSGLVEDAF